MASTDPSKRTRSRGRVKPGTKVEGSEAAVEPTSGQPVRARARRRGSASEPIDEALVALREQTGHDFSTYKPSTIRRRIQRRMGVHHLAHVDEYVRYLQQHPGEAALLLRELLIGVTSLFRDRAAFESLGSALDALLVDRPETQTLRAWVPGCSTGEEAYSIAIVLREAMERRGHVRPVRIFATDIDAGAVEVARTGAYPASVAEELDGTRVDRFFTNKNGILRVREQIRDMLVFAPQDVITDPPFARLDLISCRNLLIYLDAETQRRVLRRFHYALRPDGLLLLGPSESTSRAAQLFEPIDKRWKIYRRLEGPPGSRLVAPSEPGRPYRGAGVQRPRSVEAESALDRLLLRELVPPTVVARPTGDVVHVHGRTGLFLDPPEGDQSMPNVLRMARKGLGIELASLLSRALDGQEASAEGITVRDARGELSVDVRARRLDDDEVLVALSFEVASHRPQVVHIEPQGTMLRKELREAKEHHQTTFDALASANHELRAANEAFQSSNEELETSKEEMQALNEELSTLNAELRANVDELSRARDDTKNLLDATSIATVFLDDDLRLKRFTEPARAVVRLIASDVGRPIADVVTDLDGVSLAREAAEVLRSLTVRELEVQSVAGRWYLMRAVPYRTIENVIAGVVITFVDVTRVRTIEARHERLLDALRASPTSVFGQGADGRLTWGSDMLLGRRASEVVGMHARDVLGVEGARVLGEAREQVLATARPSRRRVVVPLGERSVELDLYVEPVAAGAGVDPSEVSVVATELEPYERGQES